MSSPYFSYVPTGDGESFAITADAMTVANLVRQAETGDWALSGTTLVPFEPVSLDGDLAPEEAARNAAGWVESYMRNERPELLAYFLDDDEDDE